MLYIFQMLLSDGSAEDERIPFFPEPEIAKPHPEPPPPTSQSHAVLSLGVLKCLLITCKADSFSLFVFRLCVICKYQGGRWVPGSMERAQTPEPESPRQGCRPSPAPNRLCEVHPPPRAPAFSRGRGQFSAPLPRAVYNIHSCRLVFGHDFRAVTSASAQERVSVFRGRCGISLSETMLSFSAALGRLGWGDSGLLLW